MQSQDVILELLRDALIELFELEAERITPSANLYIDLKSTASTLSI